MLIQTGVIGNIRHQPSSLRVDVDIPTIMRLLDVMDFLEQGFLSAAQTEVVARLAPGEIDPHARRKQLLDALWCCALAFCILMVGVFVKFGCGGRI
ncbi:hypothetical protein [Agrobacterium rosae]